MLQSVLYFHQVVKEQPQPKQQHRIKPPNVWGGLPHLWSAIMFMWNGQNLKAATLHNVLPQFALELRQMVGPKAVRLETTSEDP
jgi:hypothetical protein